MHYFPRPRLLPATMTFGTLLLGTKLFALGAFLISGVAPASVVTQAVAAPTSEKEGLETQSSPTNPGSGRN